MQARFAKRRLTVRAASGSARTVSWLPRGDGSVYKESEPCCCGRPDSEPVAAPGLEEQRTRMPSKWSSACFRVALALNITATFVAGAVPALAAPADEASKGRRVAVAPFEGQGADKVRRWVIDALGTSDGVEVVEVSNLPAAPEAEGIVKTATKNDLNAVVFGTVEKKKNNWEVELAVHNGADGAEIETLALGARGVVALKKEIGKSLPKQISGPLADSQSPSEMISELEDSESGEEGDAAQEDGEEAAAEEEADDFDAEGDAFADPAPSRSLLELTVAVKGFTRDLSWHDAVPANALSEYSLGGAPAALLSARWYPLGHGQNDILANLGLTGGFEYAFALSSRLPSGDQISSSSHAFFAGLHGRVPLGEQQLGLSVAYGQHRFEVADDPAAPLLPDADYRFIRVGIDGRFRFGSIVAGFDVARRFVTGTGQFEDPMWFPNLDAGGIDATVFGGLALLDNLDLLVGLELRRYFMDLNPKLTDPIVQQGLPSAGGNRAVAAGGATDQYLGAWLGVAWYLGK